MFEIRIKEPLNLAANALIDLSKVKNHNSNGNFKEIN